MLRLFFNCDSGAAKGKVVTVELGERHERNCVVSESIAVNVVNHVGPVLLDEF